MSAPAGRRASKKGKRRPGKNSGFWKYWFMLCGQSYRRSLARNPCKWNIMEMVFIRSVQLGQLSHCPVEASGSERMMSKTYVSLRTTWCEHATLGRHETRTWSWISVFGTWRWRCKCGFVDPEWQHVRTFACAVPQRELHTGMLNEWRHSYQITSTPFRRV